MYMYLKASFYMIAHDRPTAEMCFHMIADDRWLYFQWSGDRER